MLKRKFLITFASLLLVCCGVNASAQTFQEGISLGPSTRPFGTSDGDIVDNELFDYDAQLWSPYDITRTDGRPDGPRSGFYGEFGFAYLSLSGPGAVPGADPRLFESVVNWTWGRDFEFGFNSEDGGGWGINWLDYNATTFLRDPVFSFTSNQGGFANPTVFRATYNSVGVNRQFRQDLSTGGYIEPYVGVRYINLIDQTTESVPALAQQFTQRVNNSGIGGQVGTRYFRQYGRYRVGTNVGVGALYNDQTYEANTTVLGTNLGTFTNRADDFVPFVDLGAELGFALTRDISLRFGAQLSWAWQGVARVDTRDIVTNPNSALSPLPVPVGVDTEDLFLGGVSFGIDWKR